MSIKLKDPYILLLILSSGSLAFAFVAEYIFGLAPCPLCMYQRFPFMILIILSIISASGHNGLGKYYIITAIFACYIAGYHTGVERGIFEMSSICTPLVKISDSMSVADFKQMLYSAGPIAQCNKPSLVIFKLSLTEWNLLLNLVLLTIFIKYRNYQST
jgi:disulfide bond formation protein DsbB